MIQLLDWRIFYLKINYLFAITILIAFSVFNLSKSDEKTFTAKTINAASRNKRLMFFISKVVTIWEFKYVTNIPKKEINQRFFVKQRFLLTLYR